MIVIACQARGVSYAYDELLTSVYWSAEDGFRLSEADEERLSALPSPDYELGFCPHRGAIICFADERDADLWRLSQP